MLSVKDLFVAYGQSEALHGISFEAASKETGGHHGPQRHGQDHAVQEPDGRAAHQGRRGQRGRPGDHPRRVLPSCRQGHRLRTAGPHDLSDADRRREPSRPAWRTRATRPSPKRSNALFPVLWDMKRRKGGNLSGRPAASSSRSLRALVTNPKVLLLDEPTEGIQPSIIKDIAKALNEIRKLREITIVVRRAGAELCDGRGRPPLRHRRWAPGARNQPRRYRRGPHQAIPPPSRVC